MEGNTKKPLCKTYNGYGSVPEDEKAECRSYYLGAFIKQLYKHQFFPLPSLHSYKGSVWNLDNILKHKVCKDIVPTKKLHGMGRHEKCCPGQILSDELGKIGTMLSLTWQQEAHFTQKPAEMGYSRARQDESKVYLGT